MSNLRTLYRLQQYDSKVQELEEKLGHVAADPNLQAVITETRQRLTKAEETLRQTSSSLKNLEYELTSKETQKKQLEQKLYSGKVNNPKELGGIQQEIELLGRQKGTLEEQVLELMDRVEEQKRVVEEQRYLLNEHQKNLQEGTQELDAQRQELAHSLDEWRQKREAVALEVDGSLLKKYDAIRQRKDGLAVARVQRGTCGACGMALAPQAKTRLADGQLETCKHCGRLLVGDDTA